MQLVSELASPSRASHFSPRDKTGRSHKGKLRCPVAQEVTFVRPRSTCIYHISSLRHVSEYEILGFSLAVEIEYSPKQIPQDIQKAQEAKCDELWIVCPNPGVRNQCHRAVRRQQAATNIPVHVLTLPQAIERIRHFNLACSNHAVCKENTK